MKLKGTLSLRHPLFTLKHRFAVSRSAQKRPDRPYQRQMRSDQIIANNGDNHRDGDKFDADKQEPDPGFDIGLLIFFIGGGF